MIISEHVKKFIEENIDLIEQRDWHQLFLKWYYRYASLDNKKDSSRLSELHEALSVAFPDIQFDTVKSRNQIVQEEMENYIKQRLNTPEALVVSYDRCLESLNSRLWLDAGVLQDLFRRAAKACGLYSNSLTIYIYR